MKIFFFLMVPLFLFIGTTFAELEFVTVNDPHNAGDTTWGCLGVGAVNTIYQIGKYEVTAEGYCLFLNAVAAYSDPHHLFKEEMATDAKVACIQRKTTTDSTFSYTVIPGREHLPITYVNLYDAERFCNWLENGAPHQDPLAPQGEEVISASTETGAYSFNEDGSVTNNPEANYYIPSESEWVKAAYYKGGSSDAGYWAYPAQHDFAPNNGDGDETNQANYRTMATLWKNRQSNPVLTPVDYFSKSSSFYGASDMGGNVAEWTSDIDSSSQVLVKGGSWRSEYSSFYNNDLMRTVLPKRYNASTANNFTGFRLAKKMTISSTTPSVLNNNNDANSMMDDVSSGSFYSWTILKGLLFGCPREMINSVLVFLGINGATLLGTGGSVVSLREGLLILAIDIGAYVVIMSLLTGLMSLLSFSSKNPTTPRSLSSYFEASSSQSLWILIRSFIGCGMCQFLVLMGVIKTCLQGFAISNSLLTKIEDWLYDFRSMEIPFVPSWIIYRLVPVFLEIGIYLAILGIFQEFYYYAPTLRDDYIQIASALARTFQ